VPDAKIQLGHRIANTFMVGAVMLAGALVLVLLYVVRAPRTQASQILAASDTASGSD